jgi:diaminopimelate decarboxylase
VCGHDGGASDHPARHAIRQRNSPFGGGYTAECLDDLLSGQSGKYLRELLASHLPRCQTLILEPGKSIVQAYGVVAASVLTRHSEREAIVGACMAELPWPMDDRPVFAWRHGWHQLPLGDGVLSGRTSAETDVLALDRSRRFY